MVKSSSRRHVPEVTKRQEKFQERAMKAGIRAVKRRHHMLNEEELRALKVQVMPPLSRILLVTIGALALIGAFCGWPWDSSEKAAPGGLAGCWQLELRAFRCEEHPWRRARFRLDA